MGLQIASVIGNATKDAELKVSKDGVSYVTFRLAVSGNQEKPTFYNVVIFGRFGEAIKEHITKGREIFVNGRLEISEKGYVSIISDNIELLRHPMSKTEPGEKQQEEKKPVGKPVGRPKKSK